MPRIVRDGRELRLTFCTNAFPAESADGIVQGLDAVVPAWRAEFGDDPLGLGLWIPAAVARTLDRDDAARERFSGELASRGLEVFTLNGFPFGDFHSDRVKEAVFRPAWDDPARMEYTLELGRLLAGWIDEGETGSISTLACGLRRLATSRDFAERCTRHLLSVAAAWHRVERETGRHLILGLEPEPGSWLETTPEVIAYFTDHLLGPEAGGILRGLGVPEGEEEAAVRRHLGVCYDLCHQAVEWESMQRSFDLLRHEGIAIAKLQITNALEVHEPGVEDATLDLLARFAEPRYLHQVSRHDEGSVYMADDLELLLSELDPHWLAADAWRIHFHVPIHRETVSGLGTTRAEMLAGLRRVLDDDLTRHLEVETYTWGVLPDEDLAGDALARGIARELAFARDVVLEDRS